MAATTTVKLKTSGMHCPSCSMLIEMNVGDLEGVESVKSNYQTGETDVTFDADKVTTEKMIGEIKQAGYDAEPA